MISKNLQSDIIALNKEHPQDFSRIFLWAKSFHQLRHVPQ